jgi:hypothetical protein
LLRFQKAECTNRQVQFVGIQGEHMGSSKSPGPDFQLTTDQDAVLLTTYMPEAKFNGCRA